MNKKYTGIGILIKIILYLIWLLPSGIGIFVAELWGHQILRYFNMTIQIKSASDILIFYAGIGATIAGVLLAVIALVLTLNGQVRFSIFKENGWFNTFVTFCFWDSVAFILCSFLGLLGLYGLFSIKWASYLFILGLWGLPIIGYITRNLLMDDTNKNSGIEGCLERISGQLDTILAEINKKD